MRGQNVALHLSTTPPIISLEEWKPVSVVKLPSKNLTMVNIPHLALLQLVKHRSVREWDVSIWKSLSMKLFVHKSAEIEDVAPLVNHACKHNGWEGTGLYATQRDQKPMDYSVHIRKLAMCVWASVWELTAGDFLFLVTVLPSHHVTSTSPDQKKKPIVLKCFWHFKLH